MSWPRPARGEAHPVQYVVYADDGILYSEPFSNMRCQQRRCPQRRGKPAPVGARNQVCAQLLQLPWCELACSARTCLVVYAAKAVFYCPPQPVAYGRVRLVKGGSYGVVTWSKIGTHRIVFSSQVVCQDVPTCNLDTTYTDIPSFLMAYASSLSLALGFSSSLCIRRSRAAPMPYMSQSLNGFQQRRFLGP